MLSPLHEALAAMVRHRPALVAEILSGRLGLELPAWTAVEAVRGDLTEPKPAGFHVDAPIILTDGDGTTLLAVGNEVQLGRDPRKQYTWPHYITSLRARYECRAMLLVICVDPEVARWCAQTIEVGHPGLSSHPWCSARS